MVAPLTAVLSAHNLHFYTVLLFEALGLALFCTFFIHSHSHFSVTVTV